MKKTLEYCGYIGLILLMVVAVGTYLAPHFGWHVDAVSSGSMEPHYSTGSLVVSRPVEAAAIEIGDVITFRASTSDESLITHRVIAIVPGDSLRFQTRGDANIAADPFTVPARNVIGKVGFTIPFLGYATTFLKTPAGYGFGLVAPAVIIILVFARIIWNALTENKQRNTYGVAGR